MSSRPLASAPSASTLREAALRHLARFAATEAGLVRVLDRKIARWARGATQEGAEAEAVAQAASAARAAARAVAAALVRDRVIDDAAFAESRARSLSRAGRSRRAIGAALARSGVAQDAAQAAMPEDSERELASALVQARKRRIGPFATEPVQDPDENRRALGRLARAGFSQDVAQRALAMDRDDAELLIARLRQED